MPDAPLPHVRQLLEEGIASGLHPGAVVYASVDGTRVAELAVGEARLGVPLRGDSILLWMSSTKPIGAAAIMQLVERGKLGLDDPVAKHIPEFAAGGKQAITIAHLLTHTGGFRWVDLRGAEFDWDEIICRICASSIEADWIPGEKAGYHPFTSWYILGELVCRIDGRDFSQYVRDEIFLPLGMRDCWVGMPPEQFVAYGDRIALTLEVDRRQGAVSWQDAAAWSVEHPAGSLHRYSTLSGTTSCVPGGNGRGPARELAHFYEMLLRGGEYNDIRMLSSESVRLMTTRQRVGMYDATFRHTLDFSMGLIVNSARYGVETVPYGYGPHASDATFGHSGSQSSVAFCDPERKLVAVTVFTGMPGEVPHQKRIRAVLAALYDDLNLR